MRYLRKFSENFNTTELLYNDTWFRIEDNVKDIFVEYQDSKDLDVVVGKGHLPNTVVDLDDDVIEVKLFAQSGIRFGEISGEIGMLIEYMKSLTDKEVKIYYDLDRSGLRNWRPLTGSDNEFDYYLRWNKNLIFNTIRIYFVESDSKTNESFITDTHYKDKIVEDITDMFIELKDAGLNYLVSMQDNSTVDITIFNMKSVNVIDLDLVRDCVEMAKDYLSSLGNFTEFYRFAYRYEWVTTRMTLNGGPVDDKSSSRENIEYSSFPDDFIADVENKHALKYRFDYKFDGIKIIFSFK